MTKKKLTIPLLLLVLVIWGWIFYQVVDASGGAPDTMPMADRKPIVPQVASSPADTAVDYRPKGGYEDPFLRGDEEEEEPMVQDLGEQMPMEAPPPEEIAIDWSAIQYLGEMSGTGTGRKVVLVGFNGKDFMLREQETREGITLLKISDHAITIRYQGKEHSMPK